MWPYTLPSLPLFIWDLCRPYRALPVTYPPNCETEFEVIGVASLVSWPVLHMTSVCLRTHFQSVAMALLAQSPLPKSTKEPYPPDSAQTHTLSRRDLQSSTSAHHILSQWGELTGLAASRWSNSGMGGGTPPRLHSTFPETWTPKHLLPLGFFCRCTPGSLTPLSCLSGAVASMGDPSHH
ncbi:unnamed protein product [Pipistrellus nathusii]|uniref:Uncharacterized protein n=1 Tax=Pipistrellus nathusii TaxID=59473 RepID=A0ABP0A307_PIPNA